MMTSGRHPVAYQDVQIHSGGTHDEDLLPLGALPSGRPAVHHIGPLGRVVPRVVDPPVAIEHSVSSCDLESCMG